MASAGYSSVKIIAFDHNCDNTAYPIDVCSSNYVDGAAFHLYAGNISAMSTVKNATGKNVYFTEQYTGSGGSFSGDLGWHMQNVVIGSLNNWSKTVLEWNLANNSAIGPYTSGGCNTCLGAITINNSTTYTRNVSYYIIGQISKFVKPGAVRLSTSYNSSSLVSTSLQNADGTISLICYNLSSSAQIVRVVVGSNAFSYTLPASSSITFVWNNTLQAVTEAVNESKSLRIVPNPAKDEIILNYPQTDKGKLEIVSLNGSVLLTRNISTQSNSVITTKDLIPGIYLVRLFNDKMTIKSSFIKT